MNHWTITKDIIENGFHTGVKNMPTDEEVKPAIKFKLLDDDNITYFKGLMSDYNFAPLDNFGIHYGCTTLQYFENGEWKTL